MSVNAKSDSSASKAIDFLDKNDALELDLVPWQRYDEGERVSQVDWDVLMGEAKPSEDQGTQLPEDFVREIAEALDPGVADAISGSRKSRDPKPIPVEWDVCAWYQPIHFFAHDWGIFVRERCVLELAIQIAKTTDSAKFQAEKTRAQGHLHLGGSSSPWRLSDPAIFIRAAFLVLFLHEHYHHRIECLGLRLHVVTRRGHYVPYFKGVYVPAKGTDDLLEEALANACMYLRLSEETYRKLLPASVREATRRLLSAMFPHDPPGYRLAMNYLEQSKFDAGENLLQGYVRETRLAPVQPVHEWDTAPRLTQSFFNIKSNIYSVVPMGARTVLPTVALPHSCSTDQMIRVLKDRGYRVKDGAGKGSHVKLQKDGAAMVILPMRKDLSAVVIKNTLAALGGYRLADLPSLLRS